MIKTNIFENPAVMSVILGMQISPYVDFHS